MSYKIVCQTCGSEYDPIDFGDEKSTGQAYGCAASVYGHGVVGAYGSTVADWSEVNFINERPKAVKDGMICDTCLRNLIKAGLIRETKI